MIPDIGPGFEDDERIWVVMGATFFGTPQAEQNLTLIHETCHARLCLGTLRERTIQSIALQRYEQARRNREVNLRANDRYDTAFMFRTFNEEILAERMLRELHPGLARERVQMYRRMREQFDINGGADRMIPELRPFGLLYEIARNDLGEALSFDANDRNEFARMGRAREATLLADYQNAADYLVHRQRLQNPDIPVLPALSAFDELWNEVMRTRV
jgi:hypothetical protein